MQKTFGSSRNLFKKYYQLLNEDNNKNDPNNELSILNKKEKNSWVNIIFYLHNIQLLDIVY